MNCLTKLKKLSRKLRECLYFFSLALLLCTCAEMKEHCGDYVSLASGGQCPPEPRTTYTLTVNRNPVAGGTVSPSGTSTRNAGTSVTVTATAAEGYTFTGWTGAPAGVNSSSNSVTFNINSNVTMTANFTQNAPNTHTLTVTASAGGTTNPSGTSQYASGSVVSISATPNNANCTFTGWSGDLSDTMNPASVTMNGNRTITANFNCGGGGEEGSFTDSRDDRVYRTVRIGTQTWMAENLNYNAFGSVCYNNSTSNCDLYGRLYDWNTVMGGSPSSSTSPSGVRGICPAGWHVPSNDEWEILVKFVDPNADDWGNIAGARLRSVTGWFDGSGYVPGTDDFGFSALPGGFGWSGDFFNAGVSGHWWSATEDDASNARARYMNWYYSYVYAYWDGKTFLLSVRCLRD